MRAWRAVERAVDGAGHFGFVNFDFAFEHAAMGDGELDEAVDHGGFDGAFNDQAFGVLHGALHADAAADDQGAALAGLHAARGWRGSRRRGYREWGGWQG